MAPLPRYNKTNKSYIIYICLPSVITDIMIQHSVFYCNSQYFPTTKNACAACDEFHVHVRTFKMTLYCFPKQSMVPKCFK